MLDIDKRVRCEDTTVAEIIEALQRLPQDGVVHFEGKSKGYIHCDPDTKVIDFDTDDLDAMYDEASPEPKDYRLVSVETYSMKVVAIKTLDAERDVERVKELYSEGKFKKAEDRVTFLPTIRCTRKYAEKYYEIVGED